MEKNEIETRVESIEERLSRLERRRKDWWDKFNIVAALLIPASIAFFGFYFSESMKDSEMESSKHMKDSEIESSKHIAAGQESIARINARVGQAQLVSGFLDSLLSQDPKKQQLAIRAILIAMPEDGPDLVKSVSVTDPDKKIQDFASTSLDERRQKLLFEMFGNDTETRVAAAKELIRGWLRDWKLVPEMLHIASQNRTNTSGVINALVILKNTDTVLFLSHRKEILPFLDSLESSDALVKQHAQEVRSRFGL